MLSSLFPPTALHSKMIRFYTINVRPQPSRSISRPSRQVTENGRDLAVSCHHTIASSIFCNVKVLIRSINPDRLVLPALALSDAKAPAAFDCWHNVPGVRCAPIPLCQEDGAITAARSGSSPATVKLRQLGDATCSAAKDRKPCTHSIARGNFIRHLSSASGAYSGQLGF